MITWILAASYWFHLLATVIWLGGLTTLALAAWPAWRAGSLTTNQWLAFQQRLTPYANGSLVVLWVTGFIQMTNDTHYTGFLSVDSTWAWAILLKHLAVLGMMGIEVYWQWRVYPAIARRQLLAGKMRAADSAESAAHLQQEQRLLRLNLACAILVLLLTGIATAV